MKSILLLLLAAGLVPGYAATTFALSWQLTAVDKAARGLSQSAYRVLVASSEQKLRQNTGDLSDTGPIASNQSVHIPYKGKALASGTQAFWKVQSWDQQGEPSPWSEIATWSMGLLAASDWKAKWIGLDSDGTHPDLERSSARFRYHPGRASRHGSRAAHR